MNNGNNTAAGIKGFTTGNYYSGTAGLMPGGDVDFGAMCIVEDTGPVAATCMLFGNRNDPAGADNTQGWAILRNADTAAASGTPAVTNYSVEVYGGATTSIVPFSIAANTSRGRFIWIAFTYEASSDTLTVYVNGDVVNLGTTSLTPLASTLGPTLGGNSVDDIPATANTIFAAAYFTTLPTADALSASFVETLKRCDVVPVSGLTFDYQYNVARDSGFAGASGSGYPRTLVNYGDAEPAGDMTKQGTSGLVVSAVPVIWCGEVSIPELEL